MEIMNYQIQTINWKVYYLFKEKNSNNHNGISKESHNRFIDSFLKV